jgi:hypothetical protein
MFDKKRTTFHAFPFKNTKVKLRNTMLSNLRQAYNAIEVCF